MESILNPAYPHIFEKIFMCLNRDSISNFRLLNHDWKNTLEIVFTKDLARLILLRKFKIKELDDIFSGPEFEMNIKKLENALFSDKEDDSDDSTIANSKKPKEEFMEIRLEKDSGLCGKYWETPVVEDTHKGILQKLGKIWLNLIKFLNQENLWSSDVTENMFLCINRICCLIQHRNWKPDYYCTRLHCLHLTYKLTTIYLEQMYMAFNLCTKFGNMSLIKIIINPAYSANFMISTCHEHIRDAKESHGTFIWQVTCTNFHE